jgi:hypothetical protein
MKNMNLFHIVKVLRLENGMSNLFTLEKLLETPLAFSVKWKFRICTLKVGKI